MAPSPRGELTTVIRLGPQLNEAAVRLLEVVADDLLELLAAAVEPSGDALVEIGTLRLRNPVVGRVADEHVPEAERVVDRLVRDGSAPCGRVPRARARGDAADPERARRARPTRSRVRRRKHARELPLLLGEPVEPGGEQRLDRRRDLVGRAPSASIASNCSTKRGLPSATSRTRSCALVERCAPEETLDQLVGLVTGQWRERDRVAAPRCARVEKSGRARQRSSSGASRVQSATCSIRSRRGGSAQWMSSTRERADGCVPASRAHSHGPGDLLRFARGPRLPTRPRREPAGRSPRAAST